MTSSRTRRRTEEFEPLDKSGDADERETHPGSPRSTLQAELESEFSAITLSLPCLLATQSLPEVPGHGTG